MASVLLGVMLNLAIGIIILTYLLSRSRPMGERAPTISSQSLNESLSKRKLTFFIFLGFMTGFGALALEVIWARILIILLGTSVYAFSSMLSIYLTGIAFGSLLVTKCVDRIKKPAITFGILQIVLAFLGLLSLYIYYYLGLKASSHDFLYSPLRNREDFVRFFWSGVGIIFPITFIMGVSFPFLARTITPHFRLLGQTIGSLYAWNTLGGIIGSLVAGFFLVPFLGTQGTFCLICLVYFLIGFAALFFEYEFSKKVVLVFLLSGISFIFLVPAKSNIFLEIIAKRMSQSVKKALLLFHSEEKVATLSGFETENGRFLLINGIVTSGTGIMGEVMAHMPLLMHLAPEKALVICFGVGNTFRASLDHSVRTDTVELIEGVVDSFRIFNKDADQYLQNPNARVFIQDGRYYLLTTKQKYDVIIIDGSPPIFSAGTVNLYTREFLELSKKHLTPSGIMALWVPLPCFEDDFWMIAKNFTDTFSHLFAWTMDGWMGILLMGSVSPFDTSSDMLIKRLHERMLEKRIPWFTHSFLSEGLALNDAEIRTYAQNFKFLTDDHPYTEFPLKNFIWRSPFLENVDFLLKAKKSGR